MYEIPCLDCNKNYVVKLASLKQIYEHKRDLKRADINKSLVKYNLEINHKFNFQDSKMLVHIHKKKHQKMVESIIISKPQYYQTEIGFFQCISIFGQIVAENV